MKKLLVLGGGESGRGVALLGQSKGYEVFVSDAGEMSSAAQLELKRASIPFESGGHGAHILEGVDVVVKSPGIPWGVSIVASAKTHGIPVVGEMEFCAPYKKGVVIGITGSNGKTTTTKLVGHLLKAIGADVLVGGNIGVSYARHLVEPAAEVYVLELSSYQLEEIEKFHVDVGMVLNLSPDHLDRYEYSFEAYAAAKYRLASTQRSPSTWLQATDKVSLHHAQSIERAPGVEVIKLPANYIKGEAKSPSGAYSLAGSALSGPHNAANASFALTAVEVYLQQYCGQSLDAATKGVLAKALLTFKNEPHRLEHVGFVKGVSYVNDSKATNIDAVAKALVSFDQPIVWILGGVDKGNNYEDLSHELATANLRAIVAMGVDNQKIKASFAEKSCPLFDTGSINEALMKASLAAREGDVVLLSPACASFDLFQNYMDRGEQFKAIVSAMPGFRETLQQTL